jgi:3',5'-cyclic AMP phosphodiesterase CpdA
MNIFKARFPYIALLPVIFHILVTSCATIPFRYISGEDMPALPAQYTAYPAAEFIVFSDPHFYIAKPGAQSKPPAGRHSLGKLLNESVEIGEAALDFIRTQSPDFVLIPGDLTESGSLAEHRYCLDLLKRMERSGTQVYIIPGNHDIRKPTAEDDQSGMVTTPAQFAELYAQFGFTQALYRDEYSLSYVVEPVPDLWLCAMDATRYDDTEAKSSNYIYAEFPMETLFWMENMLIKARTAQKTVIVMMHYSLLEHFTSQKQFFPTYVVKDFSQIAKMMAYYQVSIVFTGHFHSQDITLRWMSKDGFVCDIETGSLITYPCPLRTVTITPAQQMEITTHYITAIKSHPRDFSDYAKQQLENAIRDYFTAFLNRHDFSKEEQDILIPQLSRALIAHTQGDEDPPPLVLSLKGLSPWHKAMVSTRRKQIEYIWKDLNPPDNNVLIDLMKGTW